MAIIVFMVATTIQVDSEVKDQLTEFKMPGETYNDLLKRLYKSACERQLQDLLMDNSDCVSVEEALRMAEEEYGKN
jgi:predicted CopG family antitoxin